MHQEGAETIPAMDVRERKYLWEIEVLQQRLRRLEADHERLMRERGARISELTEKCDELKMELVMSSPLKALRLADMAEESLAPSTPQDDFLREHAEMKAELVTLRQHNAQLTADKATLMAALHRSGCPLPPSWTSNPESTSSATGAEHRGKCKCSPTTKRCVRIPTAKKHEDAAGDAETLSSLSAPAPSGPRGRSSNSQPPDPLAGGPGGKWARLTGPDVVPSGNGNGGNVRRCAESLANPATDPVPPKTPTKLIEHGGHEGPRSPVPSLIDSLSDMHIMTPEEQSSTSSRDASARSEADVESSGKRPLKAEVDVVQVLEYPFKRLKVT
jgi:ribosomal protein L29